MVNINNNHEHLNEDKKLLEGLKIVKITNSSPINDNYARYLVSDGENNYSLICPTIEFNTTDRYILVSVNMSCSVVNKYNNALAMKLIEERHRNIADAVITSISYFDCLDIEYDYKNTDIEKILHLAYL